jgi:hypothetical protein
MVAISSLQCFKSFVSVVVVLFIIVRFPSFILFLAVNVFIWQKLNPNARHFFLATNGKTQTLVHE